MQAERISLSREAIALAALELIDAEGLSGLSMRKLGSKLGVEAMSLYHYVANKGDLLDAAVEQIYLEIEIPEQSTPAEWEETARAGLRSFRDTLRRHPNTISLFATEPAVSPGAFGVFYAAYRRFRLSGLGPNDAHHALSLMVSFALGHLIVSGNEDTKVGVFDVIQIADLDATDPELVTFVETGASVEADDAFEFALDTVIAGLRARFDLP